MYFGFPVAHEDDAQRAVHSGLGIVDAIAGLNSRLEADYRVQLAVRLGIHTGPVVVGEMGGGDRHEQLALGETPNIAARLEGLAQPNTVVLSSMTARLLQNAFVLETLGPHALKGVAEPMVLSRVLGTLDGNPDDRDAMASEAATLLLGRDEEIGILRRRWKQSQEGLGQVVLIGGEGGIGKSVLVETVRQEARRENAPRITFQCAQYYQNSAFHPIIRHLERLFGFDRHDDAETRIAKLETLLRHDRHLPEDTVPLLADLLSIPLPEGRFPALDLSPQQQKQATHDALAAWMLAEAERQPLLLVWEDLHWADPSTLEQIALMIDQTPTAAILQVFTYRPEFTPPWALRSHMTPLMLNHLEQPQVEALVNHLAGGKRLPAEVVQHIVTKTDGVPLYVEELTKTLMESVFLLEEADQYVLTQPLSAMAIPETLQDSLMARLDRLPTVRDVAQLAAVLGREFAYDILQALMEVEDQTLQDRLGQLVHHDLFYQRGRPPHARYTFKHALVRDAAYQSLLRRTRQDYHAQIAQLLEAHFPEVAETEPEVVAHHYTEAGRAEQALNYWEQAGQRARQRSAHAEAIAHLRLGLDVLASLPQTPERTHRELTLSIALGTSLLATKGFASPEAEAVYTRARALSHQVEDADLILPVLYGFGTYYFVRGDLPQAQELSEAFLRQCQSDQNTAALLVAHWAVGMAQLFRGDLTPAREHFVHIAATYEPQQHRHLAFVYGQDPGMSGLSFLAWTLWLLGYPEQAMQQSQAALALDQAVAHPHSSCLYLGPRRPLPAKQPRCRGRPSFGRTRRCARNGAGLCALGCGGHDRERMGVGHAGAAR